MATIEKRNGAWRAKVRKSGSSLSNTFVKKSDTVQWAAETERSIALGLAHGIDKHVTLSHILKRYAREVTPQKKGSSSELLRIGVIQRHSAVEVSLINLSPNHIAKYRDDRLKQVVPGTVRRELSVISHAVETARKEWGYYLPSNPVAGIRKPSEPKGRNRRLEGDEENRLIQSCAQSANNWLLPLVSFAIETGMRRGEMLSLEWQHVHLSLGWVHLENTKNGEARDVPLSSRARQILHDLPRDISGHVFPVHFENLKGLWKRAVARSGIMGLRIHDLRHEATSRFFEKGLNVIEVAAITGHKDLRMLQRYTHLKAGDLAKKLG